MDFHLDTDTSCKYLMSPDIKPAFRNILNSDLTVLGSSYSHGRGGYKVHINMELGLHT